MNKTYNKVKHAISLAFDDSQDRNEWQTYVEYTIVGLILLSTLEIFLSTYDNIVARYSHILHFIDVFTTAIFTIEVTLRIWTADVLDPEIPAWKARLKYCFSFYGLIDILSTYPFYLHFFMPIPYTALKALRIARLFRLFRYMSSFHLLVDAVKSKKQEMLVSLQFLVIITVILSFILFFLEHEVQPQNYVTGVDSVVWAFAQYIGDPGGFADNPPITFAGRIIACLVGILGIAIFAVPAGLIGAGFTETIEEEKAAQAAERYAKRLEDAFQRKLDRVTRYQIIPKFQSIVDIQARLGFKVDQIVEGVEHSENLRLINLAATRTIDERAEDKLAVEIFYKNTIYGCCMDRGSKVTIVSPSSLVDPIMGSFCFFLAKVGGFNYVSRELGELRPYKSFYLYDGTEIEGFPEYMADIARLSKREDSTLITLIACSGAAEPNYPTQFHFGVGGDRGQSLEETSHLLINDVIKFTHMYQEFDQVMQEKYNLQSDIQQYHSYTNSKLYYRQFPEQPNGFVIRIPWIVSCWNPDSYAIAETMAQIFNKYYEPDVEKEPSIELKSKDIAFRGYLA